MASRSSSARKEKDGAKLALPPASALSGYYLSFASMISYVFLLNFIQKKSGAWGESPWQSGRMPGMSLQVSLGKYEHWYFLPLYPHLPHAGCVKPVFTESERRPCRHRTVKRGYEFYHAHVF